MATLSSILSNALTSMQASQLGISVSSNNISNAQNPDYTRERLVTIPGVQGASIANRYSLGTGVSVVGIQAVRDQLLGARQLQENSASSAANLVNQTLSDVEVQFTDTSTTGLLQSMTNFFNSFQTLATDPASPDFRVQVQTDGQALANNFKSIHDSLDNTQALVNQSMTDKVDTINRLSQQIAQVTGEISQQEINGPANDLRDQRAGLVTQLSQIADVHELESGGSYQLTIGNNRLLVYGNQTQTLSTGTDANGMTTVMSGKNDITSEITGGELGASVDLRDNYIPKYMNSLDQLAAQIVQKVNSVHSAGYTLNGATGVNFFAPLTGTADASGLMALSSQVAADPSNIAASSASTGQDNGTATQLGNLLFQPLFNGAAVTDAYQNLVYTVGSDVSNSASTLQQHQALAQQLQIRQQSVSGVSTDEETMQMLQFQRAYQASARVISTVDQLTQTLLGMQQ